MRGIKLLYPCVGNLTHRNLSKGNNVNKGGKKSKYKCSCARRDTWPQWGGWISGMDLRGEGFFLGSYGNCLSLAHVSEGGPEEYPAGAFLVNHLTW